MSCAQHWTLEDSKKNTFAYLLGVSEKCEMCGSRLEYYFQGKWRQHSSYKILRGQVQLAQRKKSKRKRTETFIGNFENFSNVSNVSMIVNSKDLKQIRTTDIEDDNFLQYLVDDEPQPKYQKTMDAECKNEENLSQENNTISNLVDTCEEIFTFEDFIFFL
jgi:hypothetical protein